MADDDPGLREVERRASALEGGVASQRLNDCTAALSALLSDGEAAIDAALRPMTTLVLGASSSTCCGSMATSTAGAHRRFRSPSPRRAVRSACAPAVQSSPRRSCSSEAVARSERRCRRRCSSIRDGSSPPRRPRRPTGCTVPVPPPPRAPASTRLLWSTSHARQRVGHRPRASPRATSACISRCESPSGRHALHRRPWRRRARGTTTHR